LGVMELVAFAHPGSFRARHPAGILRYVAGGPPGGAARVRRNAGAPFARLATR
jgi:hypothetical protein